MPIEVVDRDGSVIEFPDGTDQRTIVTVMRQRDQEHEARARAAPRQQPVQQRSVRGQEASPLEEFGGALANVNRGLPFAQDLIGAVRGVRGMTQGRPYMEGYRQSIEQDNATADAYAARRPLLAAGNQGSGAALPAALSLGAAAPASGATATANAGARGLPLFARQTTQAGAAGGAYGALQGAGTTAGQDPIERVQQTANGANMGLGLGLVTPAAVNIARPALGLFGRGAQEALRRLPIGDRSTVGMSGANMRPPPRPPARPPSPLSPATQRRLPQLANRAHMTADRLEQAVGEVRRNPQGEVTADLFGDAGVRQLRPIVQAPGRTGQAAAETLEARGQAAPEIIVNALRRNLNVAETRGAAIRRLSNEYGQASAETYEPIFARPVDAQARQALEQRLAPYADDPVFDSAIERGQSVFARDRRNGLVQGEFTDNFARWAHYLKLGLDDAAKITANPMTSGGVGPTELRGIRDMRTRIIAAIDETIPGYQAARSRWGGIAEAEEALDEGAQFLKMDSEEVATRMAEMTPFAREHARIGLAHELQQRIGLAGNNMGGNVNVANIQALRSPEMQRRLAAVFETPEQAADFLGTARTQNRLMRNASAWGSGSQTQGNLAYERDGVLAAGADAAGDVLTGNAGRAVQGVARKVGNALFDGAVERSNNEFGADLLRRVDGPDGKAFTDELIRILRERETQAYINSQTSQVGSGIAATGQEQNRRRRQ